MGMCSAFQITIMVRSWPDIMKWAPILVPKTRIECFFFQNIINVLNSLCYFIIMCLLIAYSSDCCSIKTGNEHISRNTVVLWYTAEDLRAYFGVNFKKSLEPYFCKQIQTDCWGIFWPKYFSCPYVDLNFFLIFFLVKFSSLDAIARGYGLIDKQKIFKLLFCVQVTPKRMFPPKTQNGFLVRSLYFLYTIVYLRK